MNETPAAILNSVLENIENDIKIEEKSFSEWNDFFSIPISQAMDLYKIRELQIEVGEKFQIADTIASTYKMTYKSLSVRNRNQKLTKLNSQNVKKSLRQVSNQVELDMKDSIIAEEYAEMIYDYFDNMRLKMKNLSRILDNQTMSILGEFKATQYSLGIENDKKVI